MDASELENYLHTHIPLSRAMGTRVQTTSPEVRICASLSPNVNHRGTAFGGSLASLATLAAWSALRIRVGDSARLVIVSQSTEYLRAAKADFEAICRLPDGDAFRAFSEAYARRGKARIELDVVITSEGLIVATFHGTFAALADAP